MAIKLILKNVIGDFQAVIKGRRLTNQGIELSNAEWITLSDTDRKVIDKLTSLKMLIIEDNTSKEENFYPVCIESFPCTQDKLLGRPANSKKVKWISVGNKVKIKNSKLEVEQDSFPLNTIEDILTVPFFSQYKVTGPLLMEENSELILENGSDLIL
jgi:hypothetical protein